MSTSRREDNALLHEAAALVQQEGPLSPQQQHANGIRYMDLLQELEKAAGQVVRQQAEIGPGHP